MANLKVSGSGFMQQAVTATAADTTIYVRTTGNDSNNGLSAGSALLTIQEAIDRVPKLVKHAVQIDVGPGSFAGFYLSGFATEFGGSLRVFGDLDLATVATGTNTGTADGGSTGTLVDSGQSWTNDDLIGKVIEVDGVLTAVIYDNDGTSITYAGDGVDPTGLTYRIVEQKTELTGSITGAGLSCTALVTGNTISHWSDQTLAGIAVDQFKVDTNGLTAGILWESTDAGSANFNHVNASTFNFVFQEVYGPCFVANCYASNGVLLGFFYSRSAAYAFFDSNLAQGNGSYGGYVIGDSIFFDFGSDLFTVNNTGPGVYVYRSNVNIRNIQGKAEGNSHGIHVDSAVGNVFLNIGDLTGSNDGYGVKIDGGGTVIVTTNTAVTGSSGDATINGGTTELDWSTEFASDGDVAVNLDTQCRIERKD